MKQGKFICTVQHTCSNLIQGTFGWLGELSKRILRIIKIIMYFTRSNIIFTCCCTKKWIKSVSMCVSVSLLWRNSGPFFFINIPGWLWNIATCWFFLFDFFRYAGVCGIVILLITKLWLRFRRLKMCCINLRDHSGLLVLICFAYSESQPQIKKQH